MTLSPRLHPAAPSRFARGAARLLPLALLLLGLGSSTASAQPRAHVLRGQVRDMAGVPIAGARVMVPSLGRQQLTGPDGAFRVTGLAPGVYTVTFSRVGYAPDTRRATLAAADAVLEVALRPARIELATVQVTATPAATLAKDSPQPVAVLEGAALRASQGAALGETLEQLPGVRSLSMTSGIGKPVIRGMTHYRIVTLDNGQRTETQAWGHDHSPNVETATAERVEVIKGPASVLYGSDAIGGVVNVVAPPVPDAIDVRPFVRGWVSTGYNQAVRGLDGTLSAEAARGAFGARAAVTLRGSGDMRTPDGTLGNTNNRARAVEGAAGYRASWGAISARYAGRDERIEIFDDPVASPGYSGFQRIDTHRATVEASAPLPRAARLQLNGGYEQNDRREFAEAGAGEPVLGLFVRNWTGFANVHHQPLPAVTGTFGVSGMTSDFRNHGTQTLIPSSGTRSIGGYLFEQVDLGRARVTLGARYDYRTLGTAGDSSIGIPSQHRAFSAMTGSAGLLFRMSEPVAVVANVARGFRAPAAPDLFANGFHEGTRAFERGNPDLEVETSLNTELGVRVSRSNLTAEVTAFRNAIDDYIYLRPFGTGGNVFDSLQVEQGNARLVGMEARIAFRPLDVLTLQASGDYVRGHNISADVPLTFIPPLRVIYGARLEDAPSGGRLRNRFMAITGETNARQTRLDPRDVAPPGYTLLSASAGFTVSVPRGVLTVDLALRNAGNVRYRDFMSRYKEFALSTGRSLVLRVGTPL